MSPRRIGRHIGGGPEPEEERKARERGEELRDAFARWATGVTIVAVREEGRVHALTVSAFIPLSVDPPLVLVSLGPNASARPYLAPGVPFAISILAADQRAVAARYADTFPVGPAPFASTGPPVVDGALAALGCVVEELIPRGDHLLVLGRVEEARAREDGEGRPLAYFARDYHSIG